jgi:hypothetical protein
MVRTAILAGILLVMLSMAYSRPGALPSFERTPEPVVAEQPAVEALPPPRAEAPRAQPAPVAEKEAPAAVAAPEDTEVAEVAPEPAAPVAPARDVPPPVKAEPGRPLSLLPETQAATTQREPMNLKPLVSDDMPTPPTPMMPPVQAAQVPPAPLPEINVPTRPVMMPRDFASRLMPDSVAAAEDSASAPQVAEARAPTIAPGTKFMSPEERSRELYRLAREMEDTFIQKLTQ